VHHVGTIKVIYYTHIVVRLIESYYVGFY
jgi:hypothetical protein